ncbi:MAG: putative Cell division protein ZapA [bacterium]|nr:putative Cell division protein ZapA [bacterium]
MKRSVAVTIAGQRYTIKSDAEEAYVQTLADLVDQKVREVQRGAKTAAPHAVAVLAALQIADELARSQEELGKERTRRADLRRRVRDKSRSIRALIDREVKA